ncbi:hypothetical protein cce_5251 (plasmid) [Crocosphaera subtropica ATCC 51142]|uniref:Uncharacterized protein n=1 Tax=Crocosphaera subtropica (strain ATCC 51142 / BH68) TaxID=43989 RepID=B1X386_CROS5|nr:hypothetical protein [Crocosphaera subtropica]ACB54597.1 hypothetical protein cce_5251 [Crocosphaera subtropica ATCC 51142]
MNKLRFFLIGYTTFFLVTNLLSSYEVKSANLLSKSTIRDEQPTLLVQNKTTLESINWGFFSYYIRYPHDTEYPYPNAIYKSVVYLERKNNIIYIYNTYLRRPLGQANGCGGLGCDMGKGSLLGTLKLQRRGNFLVVTEATEQAKILNNVKCQVQGDDTVPVLSCIGTFQSELNPNAFPFTVIYEFGSGT